MAHAATKASCTILKLPWNVTLNTAHTHSNIVFQGQLYQGEAKSKSWSAMCSGQVMVYLQQKGGSGGERGWQLVAFKGEDRVHSRNLTQLNSPTVVAFRSDTVLFYSGVGGVRGCRVQTPSEGQFCPVAAAWAKRSP